MKFDLFHELATQFLIPIPDPYKDLRVQVHAHCNETQSKIYKELERQIEEKWMRGDIPKMPNVPNLDEIEYRAWETFQLRKG